MNIYKKGNQFKTMNLALVGVKLPKTSCEMHLLVNYDVLNPQFVSGPTDKVAKKKLLFSCFYSYFEFLT